eukprot:CAMPEP_0201126124 /NCGR_PEP_ID=MMETSP0850-20130426/24781_1 /ASSEMBLY_ACC=CAM_ASM_000622 /TAXON_ID=183588 /ORGANISM="Pseudo-nitzschia fraudulenta, Strain WWA7" /LENGTH=109 /DNA_ID=CAMNT_0047394427 /DNA_START=554 /DNA_END=879 /DNA_ORIENTATION=+
MVQKRTSIVDPAVATMVKKGLVLRWSEDPEVSFETDSDGADRAVAGNSGGYHQAVVVVAGAAGIVTDGFLGFGRNEDQLVVHSNRGDEGVRQAEFRQPRDHLVRLPETK